MPGTRPFGAARSPICTSPSIRGTCWRSSIGRGRPCGLRNRMNGQNLEGLRMASKDLDVLLVDDDEELLSSVEEILSGMGYRVKACASIDTALDAALSKEFAIGLIDYRLGSLKNGLDLIEELQVYHPHAKFVMITADVEKA